MKAYRCDRCGAYFPKKEPEKAKALLSLYDLEMHQFFIADLCNTCISSLHEWVRKDRLYFTDEEYGA